MRVFVASLGTESNTFSPFPTRLEDFSSVLLARPGAYPREPTMIAAPAWATREWGAARGWTVIEGTLAYAETGGITERGTYELLRNEILNQLQAALPVDAVVFGLHGAMIAEGYDDCEGDILERARALVGDRSTIGVLLDLHCHLTPRMVDRADLLVCYKESPHIDFMDRAYDLLMLVERTVMGEITPVTAVFDCEFLQITTTTHPPMRRIVDLAYRLEKQRDVLSTSIVHGFPHGDVYDEGMKVLAIANRDRQLAADIAAQIGRELRISREAISPPSTTISEAFDLAVRMEAPVIIADRADNAGGGAPSDSTFCLFEIIRRQLTDVALGPLWDPAAVRRCFSSGLGEIRHLSVGGHSGVLSGPPAVMDAEVLFLKHDATQTFGSAREPLGNIAVIKVQGVEIVLTSVRAQAYGTDLFTDHGVDLGTKRIIVVKSYVHYESAFRKLSDRILRTSGPGPLELDVSKLVLKNVRRPIWPLDA